MRATRASFDREVHLLRSMQHDNLIRLLGVERDDTTESTKSPFPEVIVTEFCSGGTLYELLATPENSFGLPEDEFLLVLFDLGTHLLLLHVVSLIFLFLCGRCRNFVEIISNRWGSFKVPPPGLGPWAWALCSFFLFGSDENMVITRICFRLSFNKSALVIRWQDPRLVCGNNVGQASGLSGYSPRSGPGADFHWILEKD